MVPREYIPAISRIYDNVISWVCMGDRISYFFYGTTGVKQGCPLSPTLFRLCIYELELTVVKFVKEEGIEEVVIGNVVLMFLLHIDDVLFENTLRDAQKFMREISDLRLDVGG